MPSELEIDLEARQFSARAAWTAARLQAAGRERARIYRTPVLTGLRKNELATQTTSRFTN